MATIVTCQLADVLGTLDSIAALDKRGLIAPSPDDLFLCALGFEPRCLTLPGRLGDEGYKARRAAYFKYATNLDDNSVNLSELERRLQGLAPSVEPIEADAADFAARFRALLDLVMSEASVKPASVTLDISVNANRLLLRCMKVLLEYDIRARIIYSEAATYHPTKEEYEKDPEKWKDDAALGLERGVSAVTPSIDHPGHALDPLPDFLILFPSFKADRSQAVTSFVDPSLLTNPGNKVAWVLGVPHLEQNRWRLDAMRQINGIHPDARQHEVSTFDYKETLRVLEGLYADVSEKYRITLSPLGSKLQALGTALFCYMHPDVRIIFSTPKEYNAAHYSEGCNDAWQVNFGELTQLRSRLDQAGTLHIDD